jgi:hypothetical protein
MPAIRILDSAAAGGRRSEEKLTAVRRFLQLPNADAGRDSTRPPAGGPADRLRRPAWRLPRCRVRLPVAVTQSARGHHDNCNTDRR